jgi:hypothetical protein
LASCVEAFGGVTGRHPDIYDHQFRPPIAHKCEQYRRGRALPHDIEARALKQTRETLTQQDVVVCQCDRDPILGHLYDYGPLSRTVRAPVRFSYALSLFSPAKTSLDVLVAAESMASSWLCTATHRPAISRQTLVFLTRSNSVPEAVARVTSK